jgi:hypothetical protein
MADDSSLFLLILAAWYFIAYVGTGVAPKAFTDGYFGVEKIPQMEYLYYSTAGAVGFVLILMVALGWQKRFRTAGDARLGSLAYPKEFRYLLPSGICTAIIIPTTTLMYTFGVSVMIAMVIMRGCIVIIGRIVDSIHTRKGILKEPVTWEENIAVVFAIAAVATALLKRPKLGEDPFSLLRSVPAMVTLTSYVVAYFVRIYIMNWYKRTHAAPDNRAFFGVEQAFAAITLVIVTGALLVINPNEWRIQEVRHAAATPHLSAVISGIPFGLAAIPSVLLLMFKGRTATFSTLVNRLTSLIAGTTATLVLIPFGGKRPVLLDWLALGLVLVAMGFLMRAELKKAEQRHQRAAANAATAPLRDTKAREVPRG